MLMVASLPCVRNGLKTVGSVTKSKLVMSFADEIAVFEMRSTCICTPILLLNPNTIDIEHILICVPPANYDV